MFQSYGIYKRLRNAAWQALVDNKITSLPVDILKIANNNGIVILKNSDAKELIEGEDGGSILEDGCWYIVINDHLESIEEKRLTIAHELGHIFLGHPLYSNSHAGSSTKNPPRTESEAERFAGRLLAPACILWSLHLHTAKEIAVNCKIPLTSAQNRAKRMAELYKRNAFLTDPLEQQLHKQFEDFLSVNR